MSGLTAAFWNDPEDRRAVPDMTENKNPVRSLLRRLDRWTLTVFNPYLHSDHRS